MLISITQEISTNASLQRDMCLHWPKHWWVDTLFYSLLSFCLLWRSTIWPWQRLWRSQFGFKGYLTTWELIRIYWRSIGTAWVLSIRQKIRCIMQGLSTSTLGSTLFERFLMRLISSYKRFTWRRIQSICLPRLFREWSLHIAKSYSISFKLLELGGARLDELRMAWSLGQRVHKQPDWVDMVLYSVRLWFKKSSLRWRIVRKECKILLDRVF